MADLRDVNLNRLAIFVAVVEAGSLTAAAERLGLAKTVVSTHMQRLESEVGANLLVRTTRRLSVTDAGRVFYDACRDIVRATEAALDAVSSDAGPLRGTLRVSVPIDYGALVVAPAVVALLSHAISNLRKEAALALGELRDRATLPALSAALDDRDPEVRKAVRIAIGQVDEASR